MRAVSIATSTSSATLSVPNSAEYGFIPQSLCVTVAVAGETAVVAGRELERDRATLSGKLELTRDGDRRAPGALLDARGAELDRRAEEHLLVDRLLDAGPVVVVQRLHAAGALAHPERARVRASASCGSAAMSNVADQEVTSISRSCPAFAAAPVRLVRTVRVALSGPNSRDMREP